MRQRQVEAQRAVDLHVGAQEHVLDAVLDADGLRPAGDAVDVDGARVEVVRVAAGDERAVGVRQPDVRQPGAAEVDRLAVGVGGRRDAGVVADDGDAALAVDRYTAVLRQAHRVEADDGRVDGQVEIADRVVAQAGRVDRPGAPNLAGLNGTHLRGVVPPLRFVGGGEHAVQHEVTELHFGQP